MKKYGDHTMATFLAILTIIMFLQVLFRYVFNQSLTWSEEISKFIFVWITFLGATICFRDGIHLKVDFLLERLPAKQKIYLEFFNTLLVTIFNIVISIVGFLWVIDVSGTVSPAIGLPINIVFYAALPVSTTFSFIYGLVRLTNEFRKLKNKI